MLATHLSALAVAPTGVAEALALADGFDNALVHGLARLDEERTAALQAFAGAFAASPLRDRLAESAAKVMAGSVADEHLVTLAGGRMALFGAVHDALQSHFDTTTSRTRTPWPTDAGGQDGVPGGHTGAGATGGEAGGHVGASVPAAGGGQDGGHAGATAAAGSAGHSPAGDSAVNYGVLSASRAWLAELAITGWRGVDDDLVAASSNVIQAVLGEPSLRRLAVLLDGLAAELRSSCPVATMPQLPVRRWGDLWARAMLLSQREYWAQPGMSSAAAGGGAGGTVPGQAGSAGLSSPAGTVPGQAGGAGAAGWGTVSGRLLILGAQVQEHETVVQVLVHGVLETAGEPSRLVRASLAASKVDTISGPGIWGLLTGYQMMLVGLGEKRGLELTEMPVSPSGDLLWIDDRARAGEPVDPFAVARVQLPAALAAATPPLDRHPAQLSELVLTEGYKVSGTTMDLGGAQLELALDLPSSGPLTPELIKASSSCLGVLRWDAGTWRLQPLAVQATVKKKPVAAHNGDWAMGPADAKAAKAAGDAVAVLRERAGRLLRK
jgi:hypothetical protein